MRRGWRRRGVEGSGWLCSTARPIFQTTRHLERIDKVRARSLLSQNNPFVRGPGWRRGASPSLERGAGGAPPAAILLFVQPPSVVTFAPVATLYRVQLARLIANNRLTSKSGLILKDNWKRIVPIAFMWKNKGLGKERCWI